MSLSLENSVFKDNRGNANDLSISLQIQYCKNIQNMLRALCSIKMYKFTKLHKIDFQAITFQTAQQCIRSYVTYRPTTFSIYQINTVLLKQNKVDENVLEALIYWGYILDDVKRIIQNTNVRQLSNYLKFKLYAATIYAQLIDSQTVDQLTTTIEASILNNNFIDNQMLISIANLAILKPQIKNIYLKYVDWALKAQLDYVTVAVLGRSLLSQQNKVEGIQLYIDKWYLKAAAMLNHTCKIRNYNISEQKNVKDLLETLDLTNNDRILSFFKDLINGPKVNNQNLFDYLEFWTDIISLPYFSSNIFKSLQKNLSALNYPKSDQRLTKRVYQFLMKCYSLNLITDTQNCELLL